jgi:hypothetical protein
VDARYQKVQVVLVIAWAAFVAGLLWLPASVVMSAGVSRHHTIELLATLVLTAGILVVGWSGFRRICAFFDRD